MKRNHPPFAVIIERDETGFYVGSVPALSGCHSQARSMETLMKRMNEVIELCLMERRPSPTPDGTGAFH